MEPFGTSFLAATEHMPVEEVMARIETLSDGLRNFWSNAKGWAPIEAAHLLSKSRLDWQVSLTACLRKWIEKPSEKEASGSLILAWANLGSLVEGTLKLFLSVYYKDYKNDIDAIKKKGELQDPDVLQVEPLRQFFKKKIWDKDQWDNWIQKIQQRRNAIHAYKDRDIGTHDEFINDVRNYLNFLRYINSRLSYPDDVYAPQEIE